MRVKTIRNITLSNGCDFLKISGENNLTVLSVDQECAGSHYTIICEVDEPSYNFDLAMVDEVSKSIPIVTILIKSGYCSTIPNNFRYLKTVYGNQIYIHGDYQNESEAIAK